MYIYDVNGDGMPDLVSSLDAHGYGVGWFEQLASPRLWGDPVQAAFPGSSPPPNRCGVSFTELHALNLADMDGDGLKDLVTGKRKWAEDATARTLRPMLHRCSTGSSSCAIRTEPASTYPI